MKTNTKKISDTRVELTVTLDAKDLEPFTEAALEKLSKEVEVKGFRKGKVPSGAGDGNSGVPGVAKVAASAAERERHEIRAGGVGRIYRRSGDCAGRETRGLQEVDD